MSRPSRRMRFAALGVGAFVLMTALEALTDDDPFRLGDFLVDTLSTALLVASATGVSLLAGSFEREREEKQALLRDLEVARAEGEAWRENAQRHVAGLGEEIEKQFEKWQLTPAEREVGLLMLKGFSHRELAGLRNTTEATVRHQAQAIYQKSALPGKSAFCAYFLEDLLPSKGRGTGGLTKPPGE